MVEGLRTQREEALGQIAALREELGEHRRQRHGIAEAVIQAGQALSSARAAEQHALREIERIDRESGLARQGSEAAARGQVDAERAARATGAVQHSRSG